MGNRYSCKMTFEDWCLKNNRQDLLDRWDYNKNDLSPSQMPSGTKRKAFFICPNGIHDSESKKLSNVTTSPNHEVQCSQCGGKNRREDLTGQVFGELTVLYFDEIKSKEKNMSYWVCECACGNTISVLAPSLKSGKKSICGIGTTHNILDKMNFISSDPKEVKRLRRSGEYVRYRNAVIEKDNGKCVVCGSTQDIEVHHIYSFAIYIADRFDANCGICLCSNHHKNGVPGSFHTMYGMWNTTPEQLEEYVNIKRQELGIDQHFDVYEYMNPYDADDMEIDDSMLDLYE